MISWLLILKGGEFSMKIMEIYVENYRKLNGLKVDFNKDINYIVGKNNIGKTSLIELMAHLIENRKFYLEDFCDPNEEIKVTVTITLEDSEIGIFDDNFNPQNSNEVKLVFVQEAENTDLKLINYYSNDEISKKSLRYMNSIFTSSNIRPLQENDLILDTGRFNFIPKIIESYAKSHGLNNKNVNESEEVCKLINYINDSLNKIDIITSNDLHASFQSDFLETVKRSITIGTKDTPFNELGFGTKFSSIIPLNILNRIMYWYNSPNFERHLLKVNGKNVLTIFLFFDEPEMHLHPNLQIKIVNFLKNISKEKNSDFNSLLKAFFNIDYIDSQIFIVTHSPNILDSDYHHICRMYDDKGNVRAMSGNSLRLSIKENKQFNRQFTNIARSYFADKVILVEGDTESLAIPEFAKKLGYSLPDHNIEIIRADGFASLEILYKLFNFLKIKPIGIIDNDEGKHHDYIKKNNYCILETKEKDFEADCFKSMTLKDKNRYLFNFISAGLLEKFNNKKLPYLKFWDKFIADDELKREIWEIRNDEEVYQRLDDLFSKEDSNFINDIQKLNETTNNFLRRKSIINGQIIAESLSKVPTVYEKAIKDVCTNG